MIDIVKFITLTTVPYYDATPADETSRHDCISNSHLLPSAVFVMLCKWLTGGLNSVIIDKSLLSYVRGFYGRYTAALECKHKATSEEDQQVAAMKRASVLMKVLEANKAKSNDRSNH